MGIKWDPTRAAMLAARFASALRSAIGWLLV